MFKLRNLIPAASSATSRSGAAPAARSPSVSETATRAAMTATPGGHRRRDRGTVTSVAG